MANLVRIDEALHWARAALDGGDSPRLDARVLLCHVLDVTTSFLLTWPDRKLDDAHWLAYQDLIEQRRLGKPVAHLVGEREFWSLSFCVSEATLIPRPDTEILVEVALAHAQGAMRILDLGTGTGAIAIALAYELPDTQVIAVDRMSGAVRLAQHNARRLGTSNVEVREGSWFAPVQHERFDIIVSNPPYIDADDPHLDLGDVRFEPASALVADEQGLSDLRHIIDAAPYHLNLDGWLILEHGYNQGPSVRGLLEQRGFSDVATQCDLGMQERISYGRWPTPLSERAESPVVDH
jgi:release factor glutamine methyltransferase